MDAIKTKIDSLKPKLTKLYKMKAQGAEIQSLYVSDKFYNLGYCLDEIRKSYLDVTRDYRRKIESNVVCGRQVRMLLNRCEDTEISMFKSIPGKMKMATDRYCQFGSWPNDSTADIISWLYGYVAFLNGMALAMEMEMKWVMPTLSLLRHDLVILHNTHGEYRDIERLWKEIVEIGERMSKWELEYVTLKEELTTPKETSISRRESVETEGS